jgi:peptide/nickel transport system substrate-binding protein
LFFRTDVAPLNNVAVRRAISYAVDKRSLVNALSGGYGTAVGTWITRSDPWYFRFEDYPYNVSRARQELTRAGFPNGIDLPMTVISNNISSQQGELVALMLREAGIRVRLETIDVATFLDRVLGKGQFVSGIVAAATPGLIVNFANGNGWFTGWNDPTFNAAIAAADVAPTSKQRNTRYRAAAKRLANGAPLVSFYNDVNLTVKPNTMRGWPSYRVDQVIDVRNIVWPR